MQAESGLNCSTRRDLMMRLYCASCLRLRSRLPANGERCARCADMKRTISTVWKGINDAHVLRLLWPVATRERESRIIYRTARVYTRGSDIFQVGAAGPVRISDRKSRCNRKPVSCGTLFFRPSHRGCASSL